MKALVIIVTIIGLSAVAGSIIVGKMVFDGKVVDKPYETGLRYDEIEKLKEEIRFEILNREFHILEEDILFSISDINGNPVMDPQIRLIISRPSTSRYDKEYPVNILEPGRFRAKVVFPMYGYWLIKIELHWKGQYVTLEKGIYVKEK